MNSLEFSEDGKILYHLIVIKNLSIVRRYSVKIPFDWTQPAENYTFLGAECKKSK